MARIRSIHPGLFTDEAFVSLSSDAQVFLMGIWTECDDQGVFEWKPVTLRMRLRPTKDGSVDGLLSELEDANCIRSYELSGRKYGAVRNFRKYQRPKKPNAVHLITDEIRTYVALSNASSELDESEDPTSSEIPPQMEEGGDKREEKEEGEKKERRASRAAEPPEFRIWYEAFPKHEDRGHALKAYRIALKKTDVSTLLEGAKRARERYSGTEKRFIPLPATWLNGERWRDEISTPSAQSSIDESCPPAIYRGLQ